MSIISSVLIYLRFNIFYKYILYYQPAFHFCFIISYGFIYYSKMISIFNLHLLFLFLLLHILFNDWFEIFCFVKRIVFFFLYLPIPCAFDWIVRFKISFLSGSYELMLDHIFFSFLFFFVNLPWNPRSFHYVWIFFVRIPVFIFLSFLFW